MFFLFLLRVLFQLTHAAAEVKDDQPPLILVSLDGMDWRVLRGQLSKTTNLNFIAQTGVRADYIRNVTTTSTWPNHQSILTGLYPESHGIVDNVFWDPDYGEQFIFGYDCSNFDPKFYNASEPRDDKPDKYRWKNYRRVPPIYIETEVGWVVTRSRSDPPAVFGSHGWPPDQSKSYSIFTPAVPLSGKV